MAAVQNLSAIVNQQGGHVLGICPPPSSTLADYVQAFVRYESQEKKTHDEGNPAPDVLTSLAQAFSCGN
jgi:D-arabinose 5-phosphate isomerase GutQ